MEINKDELLARFAKDYFAQLLGLEIIEVDAGFAKVRVKVTEQLLNGLGKTHGGALFAAADFALAVASNSYGDIAVSTHVAIDYLKTSTAGELIEVTATEESRTRKTGLYRIELRDEHGEKLALAHGTVFVLGK